jgi:hypothetical protein
LPFGINPKSGYFSNNKSNNIFSHLERLLFLRLVLLKLTEQDLLQNINPLFDLLNSAEFRITSLLHQPQLATTVCSFFINEP